MEPHLLLVLIALLYILGMGSLSVLRREGFSLQFAIEVIVVGGLLLVISLAAGQSLHPVFFILVIYLITMRSRLLVDVGNQLARRGRHAPAAWLYRLALQLRPDGPGRQVALLNQAVHLLQQGHLAASVHLLEGLLDGASGSLGHKHEAAARYNLGVACLRQGNEARARTEFNKVIDEMPGSFYAAAARIALKKGRQPKEPTAGFPDVPSDG
ncbi:MAG: tetratricopeptide repeat protein [Chloroflexota bacterium]